MSGGGPAGRSIAGADAVSGRPSFTAEQAEALARDLFGLAADARALPGERDQNFLLRSDSAAFVLKIARAGEHRGFLDCQTQILRRLEEIESDYRFPRVRSALNGEAVAPAAGVDGRVHLVRLLESVPGMPLSEIRPRPLTLLRSVGDLLATVDAALEGFDHPGADRELVWDLRRGPTVVESFLDDVTEPDRRALLERFLELYEARIAPLLPALRQAVIHNDGNDHNILVSPPAESPPGVRRLTGLVDFGDVVRSYLAAEPAIAAAYATLGRCDPIPAATAVVRGYHEGYPLTEEEIAALFPLLCLRLCVSVVVSAHRSRLGGADAYLAVSEAAAWAALERLAETDPDFAHYALRGACGLEPCPATAGVTAWLKGDGDRAGPVLEPDPSTSARRTFDLSVDSTEFDDLMGPEDAPAWTEAIFEAMRRSGAAVGIGRYDEVRRWYTTEAFRMEGEEAPEYRTVHLGVDLFAPPGTAVCAPLDGTVHAARDNRGRYDYGPTVVLRHVPADGPVFYTLYGHLSRDSLAGLAAGRVVRRGEAFARIGSSDENGGWAPHLHLQILVDPLGRGASFPGVARPRERAVWLSLSPDPNLLMGLPEGVRDTGGMSGDDIHRARGRLLGPSLSVSYRRPLHMVRGWMQHLYDADGQPYLDCVNNVAHVGHSHPRVVEALRRQAAVLNTNTRYLHESLVRYAERLTARLPEPLRVCFFVCSGSEANELALRMARAHTGRRDVIVVDGAYHGNTSSLIEISPYKFDGPGGAGAPDHVHVVPMPDGYRGRYGGNDREVGRRYAGHVGEAVASAAGRGGAAAFFCESLLSCGGQIVLPEGYLAVAYDHVRAAGGVCVADEVQVGFGRVGRSFWGFEPQGVVPDIVTMGKPIGNGHPLGAVVTTPEIAASFANGMEYFNTFGGNPVSCEVGLAVLDVIEEEGLQAQAAAVGGRLMEGLRDLMRDHALLGDVRGLGLFLGIELVLDRETRTPAPRKAGYLVERMRDHGILLSTDGPDHNVIKIKPPLVFGPYDADRLVETLDGVLAEDPLRVG